MKDPALLENACEQALLLLERDRFLDDEEAAVVRAVLRVALREHVPSEPDPLPPDYWETAQ